MKKRTNTSLRALLLLMILIAISWTAVDWYKDYKEDKIVDNYIEEIITLMDIPNGADFHTKLDHIREYIAGHSQLNMNEEFYSIWRSQEKILATFIAGIKKERDTFVPLECATRTGIMQNVLTKLGYDIRTSYVYNGHNPKLEGHVILDVLNPETRKWESQDSRYNIYWRNNQTKERVAFVDIVGKDNLFEPCNGNECGWDIVSAENEVAERLRKYLSIVSTVNKKAGIRKTVFDPSIITATKEFSLNNEKGTYCELIEKNCRNGFIAAE